MVGRGRLGAEGRRAQVTLIALVAIAVTLMVVVFFILRGREVERQVETRETETTVLKEKLESLRTLVDAHLRTATYDATWDMAAHGGYAPGHVPSLNHIGVPYWFYQGKVVNIPTVVVMEGMLARDVERRIIHELEAYRTEPAVKIGMPKAEAVLSDHDVKVTMSLEVKSLGPDGAEATNKEAFQVVLPLRLKVMRDLAEEYVRGYKDSRMIERALLTSATQDYRIPTPPGGEAAKNIDCENPPSKHRNELIYPFRENAKLAVARELRRIRGQPMENIHWNAELNDRDVNFTLLANPDREGYESTEEVRFIPRPLLPFSVESQTCTSYYFVTYNVSFPVRITLMDLSPTAQVVSQESRPLAFSVLLGIFLRGDDPTAEVDGGAVDAPETIEEPCQGSCSVQLTIEGSGSGRVCIDSCCGLYSGGTYSRSQVQCNVHDLVVTPDEPGLARTAEKINIQHSFTKDIEVSSFASVSGSVVERNLVLCEGTDHVKEKDPIPLVYVDGHPPRFIELFFAPLDRNLGEARSTTTDENGNYLIEAINPGRYVVLAVPSADAERMPGYKVEVGADIIEVDAGGSITHDIVLEPLGVELIGDEYVRVTSRRSCS